ncbi:hypothetical protein CJF30_00003832 [Rutstroemia sp. NJR-2017a BBW]|nr:hypothetical protein CJF30_00003832 [Rutstroemia sp. NJR-2017a BBW]
MKEQFKKLPTARGVLITFPLKGIGESGKLVGAYKETHDLKGKEDEELGSSGIWSIEGQEQWVTRHSPYNKKDPRAIAEDELLALGGCVLNLSGLWGGERMVKHWIDRVAGTKEVLGGKKSLHMVHGMDVARGIVGVFEGWDKGKASGERWMLTDLMVYDWWELILGYAGQIDEENGDREREGKQIKWIGELMQEQEVRALPRSMEELGRCYDTRDFWSTFGIMPVKARI